MNIYAKDYNLAVANVTKAISKDTYRPILNKIHLFSCNDRIVIESCDGFRLHRTTCYIIDSCQEFDILVDRLDKVPTDVEVISIGIKDNKLVVYDKCYDFEQNFKGNYLDTDSIFPRRNEDMTICFNAKYLKDALQQFKSGDIVELRFEQDFKSGGIADVKPIVLASANSNGILINVVLPVIRT